MGQDHDDILKAKANDQIAFNDLFNRHWDLVYGFLVTKTADPNKAEELAIEVF